MRFNCPTGGNSPVEHHRPDGVVSTQLSRLDYWHFLQNINELRENSFI